MRVTRSQISHDHRRTTQRENSCAPTFGTRRWNSGMFAHRRLCPFLVEVKINYSKHAREFLLQLFQVSSDTKLCYAHLLNEES